MITCAIGIMAKTPRPGKSKTRLCPPLEPEQAAELSAVFLGDTLGKVAIAAKAAPIVSYTAYAPAGSEHLLREHLNAETRLVLADGSQAVSDGVTGFGACLLHAMEGMFADGHVAACVLSSDCPSLPSRLLIEAAGVLLTPGNHGVLGECLDGGYYLLGLKSAHANLFRNIGWSTSSVAVQTRERAREIGLHLHELETWYDVDDAASLRQLLAESDENMPPLTKAAIERLGLRATVPARLAAGVAE